MRLPLWPLLLSAMVAGGSVLVGAPSVVASPFTAWWTVGAGYVSVSPGGEVMLVPLGSFGENGTAVARTVDAAQLWTTTQQFLGFDNAGARTLWGGERLVGSGDWALRDARTGAQLLGGTVDPPVSSLWPCAGYVQGWFSPDDALLFIGYVDSATSAARTLAYRIADGALLYNASLAGVYAPSLNICNNYGGAAFVPAASDPRGAGLMVTVWVSEPGDNTPATIAQDVTTGAPVWLSSVLPHAVSPPVWAQGMLLLPWTPCAFGEGGGVHILSALNGSRIGGISYCKECSGEFDGPSSDLFVVQGFSDGQYIPTSLQFLNVSRGFVGAFVANARPIAGDDDHVCPHDDGGCTDSIFGWAFSAGAGVVVVAQAGPVKSVHDPDVAAWYSGYKVVNGSTASWEVQFPGPGYGSFAVVDTAAGQVVVAMHGSYTLMMDASNGHVLWNGTTPVAGATRLSLCPWPACVLVQCGDSSTTLLDVAL